MHMAPYQNYPTTPVTDLRRLYRDAAAQHGDKRLFLQKGDGRYREISYRRFADDVDALSALLCRHGLIGKPIVIIGKPCYEWMLAFMGAVCTGVAVPLDEGLSTDKIAKLASHCEASLIICDTATDNRLSRLSHPVARIRFSQLKAAVTKGTALLQQDSADALLPDVDPNAMHAIFYTAGTTDTPKGVMLSHRNLCFHLSEIGQMILIEKEDVFLSIQPLHQLQECVCGVLFPMSRGATVAFAGGLRSLQKGLTEVMPSVLLCPPALPETLYKSIRQRVRSQGLEKRVLAYINSTNAIPNLKARLSAKQKFFASLHQSFGGKLRLLISGGDSVDPAVLSGLRDYGFLALQCYSVTECGSTVAINRDTYFFDDSVGMASPNALLDISESADERTGEIRYRSDGVMLGYYKDPVLTASVLRNGWLYTGDLGYLDEKGLLYVVGRKSNAIALADGRSVYPEELERLLLDTGIIEDALVVGYKQPNGANTDILAILCPDYEALRQWDHEVLTPERLEWNLKRAIASVNAQLSPHKQISMHLVSSQALPKNKNGRDQRRATAALYREEYLKKRRPGSP